MPLCTELLADLAPSFLNDTKKHAQFWKLQNDSCSLKCSVARMAPRRDQVWGQAHRVRRFSATGHFTCGSLKQQKKPRKDTRQEGKLAQQHISKSGVCNTFDAYVLIHLVKTQRPLAGIWYFVARSTVHSQLTQKTTFFIPPFMAACSCADHLQPHIGALLRLYLNASCSWGFERALLCEHIYHLWHRVHVVCRLVGGRQCGHLVAPLVVDQDGHRASCIAACNVISWRVPNHHHFMG